MLTGRCLRRLRKSNSLAPVLSCPARLQHPRACTATGPSQPKRHIASTSRLSHPRQRPNERTGPVIEDETSFENKLDLKLEDELLAIQDAAIAELEAKLGKPLQQAIEEDRLAETVLSGTSYEVGLGQEEHTLVEPTESPLALLRTGGSPSEEIVREARNIFGDYLPNDVLTEPEFVIYRRLYGDPLPEIDEERERLLSQAEDVDVDAIPENVLYSADGEELTYRLENAAEIEGGILGKKDPQASPDAVSDLEDIALAVGGDLVDEETYQYDPEEEEAESEDSRSHPLTKLGKFGTYPRTTFFSKEGFVRPLEEVMSNFSNRQLREMCERTFGGPGLPDSPLTPKSSRSRKQTPIPLEAGQNVMGQMEANAFMTAVMPPTYASVSAVLTETRKRLGASWLNNLLAKPGGPRVLDAGSGGVGILAWRDVVQAHWETLHTSDQSPPPPPETKSVVLTGSDALRHRAMKLLENTTFIPRLPDFISTRQTPTMDDDRPAQQRKQFDVIIASHSLFALREEWERKNHVQNLWSLLSSDGGVLIFIEKGIPRGFETIAAARELLLERNILTPKGHEGSLLKTEPNINAPDGETYQKTPGMIIAPCTNHTRCPLYRTPGISRGRKDICSFQQRYIRPPYLQRVLGAKDRNHDDVDFSYISVMKGEDLRTRSFSTWDHVTDPLSTTSAAPTTTAESQRSAASQIQAGFEASDPTWEDTPAPPPTHTLPRIINQPLKRQAHVTIDLCTPAGEIRRWTIPKSFSRQAYRDARKARWGDLWALGAKTNIPRNLKTGVSEKDYQATGGKISPRNRKERLDTQAERILEAEEATVSQDEVEEAEFMRMIEEDNLLDEDDINEDTDPSSTTHPSPSHTKPSKPRHQHAKLHNINIFPNSAGTKHSSAPSSTRPSRPTKSNCPGDTQNFTPIDTLSFHPGRYGEPERENLESWSEDLDNTILEDEAREQLSRSGRRATAKNTQRLKRELRRVKREMSRAQGAV